MQPTNTVVELPIDATGEAARYTIDSGTFRRAQTVAAYIEGSEAASYRFEFGEKDESDTIRWFPIDGDFEYTDTTGFHDSWRQSEAYLRIVVTTSASSGATADVSVSKGR